MAENGGGLPPQPQPSSSATLRHTINLPPRTSMETLFTGGSEGGVLSPGPMTLVSNFFSDNDPHHFRSFSQLLTGAMSSPAELPAIQSSSMKDKEAGNVDFRFNQIRPAALVVTQPPTMFTIPPGFSPATLLDSPGFFSSGQGPFGMSHQTALAQVTVEAVQAQSQMQIQDEYRTLSAAPTALVPQILSFHTNPTTHHQMQPPIPNPNILKESSDFSHSDQRSHLSSFAADKPADDGYNWRKYGQKQVKGGEYPRSYYKCTHPNCPVKKKVERSLDGQVTEIIYKGQHNHPPPQSNKHTKVMGNPEGTLNLQDNSELGSQDHMVNENKSRDMVSSNSLSMKDHESSQAEPEQLSGSSDSEEVVDTQTRVDENDEDEPESKRRNTEVRIPEQASSHRTVTESRIIVQTTSEVDLLVDGYRWRKYGQKVVKGNPYPRSYYKCTNPGCNVRKHVERAASDPKAVITAYEGKHNHDVPAARNNSHNNTANNNVSQQRPPHNSVAGTHSLFRTTEFGNNEQQSLSLLRFKEEKIT